MRWTATLVAMMMAFGLASTASAQTGLSVAPGTLVLSDVPLGRTFDLDKDKHIRIRVGNGTAAKHRYLIAAVKPSHIDTRATGYWDFPDTTWVKITPDTLDLEPSGSRDFDLSVTIPDQPQYYNQHWLLGVSVLPDPNEKSIATISMGAYALYRFETPPMPNVDVVTPESILIAPSVTDVGDIALGATASTKVRVFNNTPNKQSFQVVRLDKGSDVAQWTLPCSGGRVWPPQDQDMFTWDQSHFDVEPLAWVERTVTMHSPKTYPSDRSPRLEDIFLVYPQTAPGDTLSKPRKAYVRVRANILIGH